MTTRALVLDIWSELNRGDGAMQFTIIDNLHRQGHAITAVADYGPRDLAEFRDEFDESRQLPFELLASLKFTNYAVMSELRGAWLRRFVMLSKHLLNIALFYVYLLQIRSGVMLSRRLAQYASTVTQTDTIIWNGRNFRSNKKLLEFFEVFDLLFMYRLTQAILRKHGHEVHIPFVGISVWRFKSDRARQLFLRHLTKVRIFARETKTFAYLKEIGSDLQVEIIPDLSFYCLKKFQDSVPESAAGRKSLGESEGKIVGIVLKEWTVDGAGARDGYLEHVVNFLKGVAVKEIFIIEQVPMKKESTDKITEAFVRAIATHNWPVRQFRDRNSIHDLLRIYAQTDVIVTSRMHGAIFALSVNTPPVCIAYDKGAKWHILQDMGISVSNSFSDLSVARMQQDFELNQVNTPSAREAIMRAADEIAQLGIWK
jgi:polysaccharide pyruvyl transferase WcaK-like protein